MKVLVTGGSGFLGRPLVSRLLAQGIDVRCLVRNPSSLDDLRAAVKPGWGQLEIRSGRLGDLPLELAEGCEVIYHLASDLKGGTAGMFLTNVVATRGLLVAARKASLRRFVLVSSLGVYGTSQLSPRSVLDESCPLEPEPHLRDPYSFSKVAQEQVAWEAHREGQCPLVVVRPAVIYGPGREAITARVGLRLGRFVLQMGGRHPLPYTYVENCAQAVLLAGTVAGVEGEAFNVVDDELPSGRQILKRHRAAVSSVASLRVPRLMIGPVSRLCEWYHTHSNGQLPAVLTRYKSEAQWKPLRYSNAKAKTRLGWTPAVNLDEGLRRTFAALSAQRDGQSPPGLA